MKHLSSRKSAWVGIISIALLFGACSDPLSIADFVKQHSSKAALLKYEIPQIYEYISKDSLSPGYKIFGDQFVTDLIVFYVEDPQEPYIALPTRNGGLSITIDNPQGYTLSLVPNWRVYNPDGEEIYPNNESVHPFWKDDPNPQRMVIVEQITATEAELTIYHAAIGERYEITIGVSMNDGSRVFETFEEIPPIVFNTRLKGPRELFLFAFNDRDTNGAWYPYAQWDITQLEKIHPGINKITVVFKEEIGYNIYYSLEFVYDLVGGPGEEKKWVFNFQESEYDSEITMLDNWIPPDDPNRNRFQIRFPMGITNDNFIEYLEIPEGIDPSTGLLKPYYDSEGVEVLSTFNTFIFSVIVEDQYGLMAQSGFDSGMTANETTILKDLKVMNALNSAIINENFFVPGFVNYSMEIPYPIGAVNIIPELNEEYPDQEVTPAGYYGEAIQPGRTSIFDFEVTYPGEDDAPYAIFITRQNPVLDSNLAKIYAKVSSVTYDTLPAFELINRESLENTKKVFTIYVPSAVDKIDLFAELPAIDMDDERYSKWNWEHGTIVPSIVSLSTYDNKNPENMNKEHKSGTYEGTLQGIHGWWENLELKPGSNMFVINVQPEAGLSSSYTVSVVRSLQTNNTSANLAALAATATTGVYQSPGFDGEKIESYTANVRNNNSISGPNVTITATVSETGAKVTNIRTLSKPNSLDITVNGSIFSTTLTGLWAGESHPVIITVVAPDGVSRKDYHLLVNMMLPSVTGSITRQERNNTITLTWPAVNLNSSLNKVVQYELYYHTANLTPGTGDFLPEIVTSTAAKWAGSATTAAISGLENARQYWFWLRATYEGVPGEMIRVLPGEVIQPRSNIAYLAGIEISGGVPIVPLDFSAEPNYRIMVPSSTSEITVTGNRGEPNQTLAYRSPATSPSPGPEPAKITLGQGGSGTASITVTAHDGTVNATPYVVTVDRLLPGPASFEAVEGSEKVTLNWAGLPGPAGIRYEVYYNDTGNPPVLPGFSEDSLQYIKNINANSREITGLTNMQRYYFWVRGVVNGVYGEWSDVASAVPKSDAYELAEISTSLTTMTGLQDVKLSPGFDPKILEYSLTVPSDISNVPINIDRQDIYQIINYHREGQGEDYDPRVSDNSIRDIYILTLDPGTSQVLSITSRSQNNEKAVTYILTVNQQPGMPSAFTVSPGNRSASLSWSPAASTAVEKTVYELRFSKDIDVSYEIDARLYNSSIDTTSTIISGLDEMENDYLDNGHNYYFYLRARALGGQGGTIDSKWTKFGPITPKSDVAKLESISPPPGYFLSPPFSPNVTNYTLISPQNNTGSFILTAKAEDNGTVDGSTMDTVSVTLAFNGSHTFTVTSQDGNYTETYTINPKTANIVFVPFVLPEDKGETIDLTNTTPISWKDNTSIVIEADSDVTSYPHQWYKDNALIQGASGNTLSTNAREFSIGRHTVSLRITVGGKVYSKSVMFEVER